MKTKKILALLCASALLCCCVLFAACNDDNTFENPGDYLGGGGTGDVADSVDTSETEKQITDATDGDLSDLSENTGSSDSVTIEATTEAVEISESGTYILSGEYSGGISVTEKKLSVHIILNGASISNSDGVAIATAKNTTMIITLAEGTTNTVENSGDDVNAIHVKGSLSINGSGTLEVVSNSKSGIKASGALQIVDAALVVSAANHAITALSVTAENCTINVSAAGKDGINAECDDETTAYTTEEGFVSLKNVDFACNVSGDGIQADTFVYVDGGTYNITTNGEFVAYSAANMTEYDLEADDFRYIKSMGSYQKVASDYQTNATMYALKQSCKGIKVGEIEYPEVDADGNETGEEITVTEGNYTIMIVDGTFSIDATDDAIHANCGDIYINGGSLGISTYDDGVTADCAVKISGGKLVIESCYEGVEGATVEIYGGTVDVVASDDGINAASDDESATMHIIIGGGEVTVDAGGDGIDSNGSILISGGTVTVYGPTNGGDAGLDAENGIVVTGGTLFVTSTLGMVETPSTNSTQYVVSFAQSSNIAAGTVFYVADSDGNVLMEITVKKACQSVIFSLPELENGQSYTIFGGDTQLASFTVSSIITSVGTASSSNNPGGRPGSFGPGGGRR